MAGLTVNPCVFEKVIAGAEEEQKGEFTAQEFDKALIHLDNELSKSKTLRKYAPVKLIAVGGYVAVAYLHNRELAEDLDYILDPSIPKQKKIREKLQAAGERVAASHGYAPDWINDNVAQFVGGTMRLALFCESMAQNTVIWAGKNLKIYAVQWEWALARKFRRIGSEQRHLDIDDAAALLHEINDREEAPLEWDAGKAYNALVYCPIEDHVLNRVATYYKKKYGVDGVVGGDGESADETPSTQSTTTDE